MGRTLEQQHLPKKSVQVESVSKHFHPEKLEYVRLLVERAANTLKADQMEYLGSMTMHCFVRKETIQHSTATFFTIEQLNMDEVPEQFASKALDELRGGLMKFYGRLKDYVMGENLK